MSAAKTATPSENGKPEPRPKPYTERYPGQFARYQQNPAAGDYEAILGKSPVNVRTFEEFERVTEPLREREKEVEEAAAVAAGYPAGDAASDSPNAKPRAAKKKKKKHTPRCTKKEKNRRLEIFTNGMTQGMTNAELKKLGPLMFNISERSALIYMKQCRAMLANAASKRDHLAHLELSKRQHEHLYSIALSNIKKIEDPTKVASLIRAANCTLKQRDAVQEDIRHHRVVTRRDKSPDSKRRTMERNDYIYMPKDEFFERLENLRNIWWYEFGVNYNDFLLRSKGVAKAGGFDPMWFETFMEEERKRPYPLVTLEPGYWAKRQAAGYDIPKGVIVHDEDVARDEPDDLEIDAAIRRDLEYFAKHAK
jgi:hypothetical protein